MPHQRCPLPVAASARDAPACPETGQVHSDPRRRRGSARACARALEQKPRMPS